MLPFYGRRLSRKTKKIDSFDLENYDFFFNEINFSDIKKKLVKHRQNVNLEIGFGKGENLIFQSQEKKKDIFFAIDPFISGGLKLKKKIEILKISNIFFSYLTFSQFFEIVGDDEGLPIKSQILESPHRDGRRYIRYFWVNLKVS